MKAIFYLSLVLLINLAKCHNFVSKFTINSDEVPCPCSNPQWCNPITDTSRKEIFAFSIANDESHWNLFDWSKLTTVVMFGYVNDTLMCLAHSHNVRVVILGTVDEATFIDPTKRQAWVRQQFQLVQAHFLDGLNFDFESSVDSNEKSVRDAYTALVQETNEYFKKELPYSQISVDVGWKPNADIRFYDYQGLADNSDLLFVMAYDEQSQILGECLALPNSALAYAVEGLNAYLNTSGSISPDKLVLGLPWYGYIYPCLRTEGDKCYIKEVPFRGVNCSDAAGRQYDYGFIHTLVETIPQNYRWNASSATPYLSYLNPDTNQTYQIQFDDPMSLKMKYDLAAKMGLRGVGMWNIDSLDYSDSDSGRQVRDAMFGALPSAAKQNSPAARYISPRKECPCSRPELCNPITNTTRKEVYAFSVANDENYWNKYDWSKFTTICSYGYINTSLMCLAHSHNVRVVALGFVTQIMMITPELRADWISKQLTIVQENYYDGLNFDLEIAISPRHKDLSNAYTALVSETNQAFKKALPYSQISVDVIDDAFSTYRAYDYPGLAAASDFLFIMAYDESGYYYPGPNSDYYITSQSIDSFTKKNISPDKLVLGLPWYGYVYECIKLVKDTCTLNKTKDPHHLPASQDTYAHIYQVLELMPDKYRWNNASLTPFFSYTNSTSGQSYQIQFDDPKSLKLKYDLAAHKEVHGVGFWTIDFLDYSNTQEAAGMRQAMFEALPSVDELPPRN
jgi:di-N-acetylchitobiase